MIKRNKGILTVIGIFSFLLLALLFGVNYFYYENDDDIKLKDFIINNQVGGILTKVRGEEVFASVKMGGE